MSLLTQIRQPIKHWPAVLLISAAVNAYGAATSTVLPYIQEAQLSINTQVTTGMTVAKNRIDGINESAKANLKTGYEKKEGYLQKIKTLNSESLLLMKEIEAHQASCADLRSTKTKLTTASSQSSLINSEKTTVSTSAEEFK